MFTKRVIPCLDCKNGRVVKGTNFIDLRDAGDPVEVATAYDKEGADEIVFLDITATSDDRNTTVDLVRKVAEKVFIPFTVGGGIRTVDDFRTLLREGADKISVNSAAINNPDLINQAADKFGSQCVVVAMPKGVMITVDLTYTVPVEESIQALMLLNGQKKHIKEVREKYY